LNAPSGRRPVSTNARFTLRHLGRELNGAATPPPEPAGRGLRASSERWVAVAVEWSPASTQTGATLPLASAALHLVCPQAAEVVLELREDLAGAPGRLLAAPLVHQLDAGTRGWVEFEPRTPLGVPTGRRLWLLLRSNQGEALWSAGGTAQAKVSHDQAETWSEAALGLADHSGLLAQLFHSAAPPSTSPALSARLGSTLIASNLIGAARTLAAGEYAIDRLELPTALLEAFRAPGATRRRIDLSLFSPAALDLTPQEFTLFYDPLGGG
jgi:hypothetical protein